MPLTLMNRHKKYLMALVLALAAMTMTATELSVESALATATRFMASKGNDGILSNHKTWQLAHIEHSTAKTTAADYYIFNASDGSAFVIIAGDDRANVVLAYGNGAIDMSNLPDNLRWMLNHYSEQIEHLINHPGIIPRQLSTPSTTVSQLINTEWGQRTPYRDLCPTVDGKPCITGCVATSMAQVMNYWKFPSVLPELPSYMTSELHIQVEALLPTSVEWDLMLDSYHEGTYTQDQGKAVATLMRYCGQASKMDYTIASSGALMSEQLKGLKIFGYNQGATYLDRSEYSDEDWTALLLEDLSASRPVIYSGMNYYTSHSFIIDGYDGSKFHVNWGWDGLYDGYFELDAMNGGGFTPSETHQMLHGVCPDEGSQNPQQYDFVKNGITYIILSDESVAISQNPNYKYSGDLIIPDTVRFSGKTYHVTAINEKAFASCTGLKSVVIPSSITSIGSNAFSRTGLSQVTIPSSVSAMGTAVFFNCTYLKHVELNHVITTIQDHMFEGCNALSSIVIPDEVTSICDNAFMKSGLTSIVIPDNVTCIGTSAFEQCDKLSNVTIGFGISAISPNAFKECTALRAIELPENVTDIGDNAFMKSGLTSIVIPNNVTSIGTSAFKQCKSLSNVTIGSGISAISHSAFKECTALSTIELPENVTDIGDDAFNGAGLKKLTIPMNINQIGNNAFRNCSSLTDVTLESASLSLGNNAFYNSNIVVLTCFSGYPPTARANCFSSTVYQNASLFVPSPLEALYRETEPWKWFSRIIPIDNDFIIVDGMYFNRTSDNTACLSLYNGESETVIIPDTLVFNDTTYTVTAIGYSAFENCQNLQTVVIPNSVTAIGNWAFMGSGLTSIVIPNNVTSIGTSAFEQCKSLSSVTIGNGIMSISYYAFKDCNSLSKVICQAQTHPTLQGSTVFNNNTYDEATLYVPFASIPDYLTATGWKLFANVESIDNEIIIGDVNCDGEVNISDINSVLDMILNGGTDLSGDVNDDQEVNIDDINIIIQIIIDYCQPDPSKVAVKPVIIYDKDTFTVSAISPDNVVLMVNNEVVENPYTFEQTDEDTEYIVSAYSWAEGKMNSGYAWKRVLVHSDTSVPQTGYWLVLITANGKKNYYELQLGSNGDYIDVLDLIYPEFIDSCPFYFMINGIAYGAPEEMYEAVLGDPYMNPLVQGTCCYIVPTGYSYTIGIHYSNEEFLDGYYAYVAKGGLAGIEKDSSSKRLMKNPLKASNSLSPRW